MTQKKSASQISIRETENSAYFEAVAKDKNTLAGTLKALIRSPFEIYLHRIRTEPKYRKRGIARQLLDRLTKFKQPGKPLRVHGDISETLLKEDTKEHVTSYLKKQGFTVEDDQFWKDY